MHKIIMCVCKLDHADVDMSLAKLVMLRISLCLRISWWPPADDPEVNLFSIKYQKEQTIPFCVHVLRFIDV